MRENAFLPLPTPTVPMRLLNVVQGEDRPSSFWGAWGQLWDAGMLLRRFSEP